MKTLKCLALFLAVVLLSTMTVITSSANEATETTPSQKIFTLTGSANAGGQQKNAQRFSLGAGTYTVTVISKSATTTVPDFLIYVGTMGESYKLFKNNDSSLGANLDKTHYSTQPVTKVDDVKKEYTFTITEAVTENKDIYIGFVHDRDRLQSANYEFTWSVAVTNSDGTKFYPADSVLYSAHATSPQYYDFDYGVSDSKNLSGIGTITCTDYDETVFYPLKTVTVSGRGDNTQLKFFKKVENVSAGKYKVTFSQRANNMSSPAFYVLGSTAATSSAYTLTELSGSNYCDREYNFTVVEDGITILVGFIFESGTIKESFSFSNLQLVKENEDGSYGENLISWLGYKDWYRDTSLVPTDRYTTMGTGYQGYLVTISDYNEYDIYPEQIIKFSIKRKYQGQQYFLKKASLTAGTYTASFAEYGYGINGDKLMFAVRTADNSEKLTLGDGALPQNATLYSNEETGLNSGEITFTLESDTDVFIGFLLYDAAREKSPEFYVTELTLTKENDDTNLVTPLSYVDWYKDTTNKISEGYYLPSSTSSEFSGTFINAGLTDKSGNGGSPDGALDIRDLVAIYNSQIPTAINETTGVYTYPDDNAFAYDLIETRLALLNDVSVENKPVEKFS